MESGGEKIEIETSDGNQPTVAIPLVARNATEIPKPKDHAAFQRNCVYLFSAELKDPHAKEYGRNGQGQGGIDILARRDGRANHFVGVQCRHVVKPLRKGEIERLCREALTLKAEIKEMIFATTAPNDTTATDDALEVERKLGAEGVEIRVEVYGWGQLQLLIAAHDLAYRAFVPSAVSTSATQAAVSIKDSSIEQIISGVSARLCEEFSVVAPPVDRSSSESAEASEDPILHARIDTLRDLLLQDQHAAAETNLLKLLDDDLSAKPWAHYRILANLASAALGLGKEELAAERYEKAYELRPTDPKAIANLGAARLVQKRYDEAIELTRRALAATPRADHAVGYLLQAAARSSSWDGNPDDLIPADLVGTKEADLGLSEYLRRREVPGWENRVRELATHHPDEGDLQAGAAIAVLSLALQGTTDIIGFGEGPGVNLTDIDAAASFLLARTERMLDRGFADEHDLAAHLNNAGILLRIADRVGECVTLLERGITRTPNEPVVARLLALSYASQNRHDAALKLVARSEDPESALLAVELMAELGDPRGGLSKAMSLQLPPDPKVQRLRWRVIGDAALAAKDPVAAHAAADGMRNLGDASQATLLDLHASKLEGASAEELQTGLRALAAEVPTDADLIARFLIAEACMRNGLASEAADLLENHVDVRRNGAATHLYLQVLAEARRDKPFAVALAAASDFVRDDPEVQRIDAIHAWNVGDLPRCLGRLDDILRANPDTGWARLLKMECLAREDRSDALLAELDKPIELLELPRMRDRIRVAQLLGFFGHFDRAADLAYRLLLENRDQSVAWLAFIAIILTEGMEATSQRWKLAAVADNAGVTITYDDGAEEFFVIEPNASLRSVDDESWEPDHPLAKVLVGKVVGDAFTAHDGRSGKVKEIRHKYVARLHHATEEFERRFPDAGGFYRLEVDPAREGGLDELIAQLRERHEWIDEQRALWKRNQWPIAALANRTGADTIEVAAGVISRGDHLPVAFGNIDERQGALRAMSQNARRGCVIDLLTYWTASRIGALPIVERVCGKISVPRSVIDTLRTRRERMQFSVGKRGALRTASYENGKVVMEEHSGADLTRWLDNVQSAIAWLEAEATIAPIVIGTDLPPELQEMLRGPHPDLFDAMVIGREQGILLVSDDLPTRRMASELGTSSTWLHQIITKALVRKYITFDEHVRLCAALIEAGQTYIGTNGSALARTAMLDFETDGSAPSRLFNLHASTIGGENADPESHVLATVEALHLIFAERRAGAYCNAVSSHLLARLITHRTDFRELILAVMRRTRGLARDYVKGWAGGHFLNAAD